MNIVKIKILLVALLLGASTNYCLAQSDSLSSGEYPNDPLWYFSFGVAPYSHYISAPPVSVPFMDTTQSFSEDVFKSYQYKAINLLTFTYSIRYNIFRIDDDRSLSLNVPVSLGLTSVRCNDGSRGFLSLSVPLMLEFNSGAASNFSTLKWTGWMFGAGADFNVFPLISNEKYAYFDQFDARKIVQPSHSWIQPSVEFAYRWINTDQNTRELNLKMGYGLPYKVNGVAGSETYHPFSVKISYFFMINY